MELARRTFAALAAGSGLAVPAHTDAFEQVPGTDRRPPGRPVVRRDHPFRLPSPSLWCDVPQKLRAYGLDTVGIYVAWNHHSPTPGRYDFTGVRDLDLFLRMAAEEGLYVIVRPGPYLNSETDEAASPAGRRSRRAGPAPTARPVWRTRTST